MTAEATVRKLILYAEHKKRLSDSDTHGPVALHSQAVRKLRRDLTDEGVSPELLNLSGDEIAEAIYDAVHRYV